MIAKAIGHDFVTFAEKVLTLNRNVKNIVIVVAYNKCFQNFLIQAF